MSTDKNDDATLIPPRADRWPFWVWEHTNAYAIGEGHCSAPGGSNSIDGPDPCCRAGFPGCSTVAGA